MAANLSNNLSQIEKVTVFIDTLTSHFNPDNFLPYEFCRKAHEGTYHKTFDYTVDYDSMRVYGETHKIGKYFRKYTIPLQPLTCLLYTSRCV